MATVYQIVWPVFFHQFAPADQWYPLFECGMSAFEALDCAEFL